MSSNYNKLVVKLKWTLDETKVNFVNEGLPLLESFTSKDIYLVKNNVEVSKQNKSGILKDAIILKEIDGNNGNNLLCCNDKKCLVVDVDSTLSVLASMGYKQLFCIDEECLEYFSDGSHVFIEYEPDLGLFLKIDNDKSFEENIKWLKDMNIAYYENDFFVKKDELMLNKIVG